MSERQCCAVCDEPVIFRWADAHGIAVCTTCGMPYILVHYAEDADGKRHRVYKPPCLAFDDAWVPVARKYWRETRRRVFPGVFDCGVLYARTYTYSGATENDIRAFDAWITAHADECPAPKDVPVKELQ